LFITTSEIGKLTKTTHGFILERATDALRQGNLNPDDYWRESELGFKRSLHLPKRECLLVLQNEWFSEKARAEVKAVWNAWELNDVGLAF
jgi:hypothetical protein